MYIHRQLEPTLEKAISQFPSIILTGPRQSGKTTLLKKLFANTHKYISLEVPDVRSVAVSDPRGFLSYYKPPVIFDEVQYAPELLPYIKEYIDENRLLKGQFILSGSQNLLLSQHISETLPGRVAVFCLLPLSFREITGRVDSAMPWENEKFVPGKNTIADEFLWRYLMRGGYPELNAEPNRDEKLWHAGYIHSYLERDLRTLRQIGDLTQFQVFIRTIAARNGQLFNMTEVSRELGLAVNTVKAWLSVLEASYQIIILRPYYKNAGKRLVKTPKIYLMDTGTLCYLTGIRTRELITVGPFGGSLFEAAVLLEIIKYYRNQGMEPNTYFWRTSSGNEVDIVIEANGKCIPIEIKLSSTPKQKMISGIDTFRKDFPDANQGYLIHSGDVILPLGINTIALPFRLM
ncbi:MAG: ATP-binding protein [Phycisphaerae bacterium]|nr:ATP-binding protein [Phycisphaerae bacterium]